MKTKNERVTITTMIRKDLRTALRIEAAQTGRTIENLLDEILDKHFGKAG